jgi:hypothetical protein
VTATALAACGGFVAPPVHHRAVGRTAAPADVLKPLYETLPATEDGYLGVYEADVPSSYAQIDQFAETAGRQPNLILYYSGWGEPFQISFARTALAQGATVVVDLDPTNVTLSSIASGSDDSYLVSYARQVLRFGHPVVISFGHEMNGNWYPWGWTHTSPHAWVRAWRHVVKIFRRMGADNVAWLWTINELTVGEGPIQDWWPGAAYVSWIGIDSYYYRPTDTFTSIFGPAITAIRQLTSKPILIGETAVGQVGDRYGKISDLFAGMRDNGLLGFVWFDVAQHNGLYHQDWRLEGHPAASAEFRRALATYFKSS